MSGPRTWVSVMWRGPAQAREGRAPAQASERIPLLARCQRGDEEAWRRLILDRAAQVFRWAVLLGLGPAEAEDAAQEVFAVAARRIATCRADEAVTSWLFQITRRVCANQRRQGRWRRWLRLSGDQDGETTIAFEPVAGNLTDELGVRACLRRISPRLAEVLVLMDLEGLTREEVAEALGIPAGTVASRLRLAREAFQTLWDGDGRAGEPAGADKL